MVNVRQVPSNDTNDYGAMTLYDYLCNSSKPYFNYAHLNFVSHALPERLYNTAQYHNKELMPKIKDEFEPYNHKFLYGWQEDRSEYEKLQI